MKGIKLLGGFIFGLSLLSYSCVFDADKDARGNATSDSAATGSSFEATKSVYVDLSGKYGLSSGDVTTSIDTYSSSSCAPDVVDGIKIYYTLYDTSKSTSDTNVIRIDLSEETTTTNVVLTGTMTSGGVKIQTNKNLETGVTLSDVSISSSNYPCLEITKAGAVSLCLEGENTFIDGRSYGTGYGEQYSTSSGATYTDDDGNTASCTVSSSVQKNGSDAKGTLYSKGDMTIYGDGELTIQQAYKNCIASKGILTIEGGTITAQNYKGSIKSTTGKNGFWGASGVLVSGGNITFNGYGIVSTSDLRKANAFKTDDDNYSDSWIKITGGTTDVTTYNGKGLCAPLVYISGGTNSFVVTGTTSYSERTSTGSWKDADGVTESGTVKFAPEGIEAETLVSISGGVTYVSAPDDGVNVSTTGGNLNISGGFIYVSSNGDGLDSNGNITISGGTTVVSQTGGGNSPIDCGDGSYKFTVTGSSATVFAMGSSDMFSESVPSSTVNPYIKSTSLSGSSSLAVKVGSDYPIAVEKPQTYGAVIFISSKLTSGSSYSFVKGGTISGTDTYGLGVYIPASVSGGSSISCTATTASGGRSGGPGRELEWFFEDF